MIKIFSVAIVGLICHVSSVSAQTPETTPCPTVERTVKVCPTRTVAIKVPIDELLSTSRLYEQMTEFNENRKTATGPVKIGPRLTRALEEMAIRYGYEKKMPLTLKDFEFSSLWTAYDPNLKDQRWLHAGFVLPERDRCE